MLSDTFVHGRNSGEVTACPPKKHVAPKGCVLCSEPRRRPSIHIAAIPAPRSAPCMPRNSIDLGATVIAGDLPLLTRGSAASALITVSGACCSYDTNTCGIASVTTHVA